MSRGPETENCLVKLDESRSKGTLLRNALRQFDDVFISRIRLEAKQLEEEIN